MKVGSECTVFNLGAAVCISSITPGRLQSALFLSLCVLCTVLVVRGVALLSGSIKSTFIIFWTGALTVCLSVSALRVLGGILGLTGLEHGVFVAAGSVSSILLTLGFCDGECDSFSPCVYTAGVYTVLLTASGTFRELLGHGTLWGREIALLDGYTAGVLKTHTGGMLVCAVLLALAGRFFASKEEPCGI